MTTGETIDSSGSVMTSETFRQMAVRDMVEWIARHGEPPDQRENVDTASLRRRFPHLDAVQVVEVAIDGPGGLLPGRTYRDPTADGLDRGLVWAHGGAFLGGRLDMPEANWVALELAARGIPVLSVDYRKCVGGVHYPAPSDDVLSWWDAATRHAPQWLGVDAAHLVLGGASAGATLTASAVQRLIERESRVPGGLLLVYPPLHPDSMDPSAPISADTVHGLSLNYAGSTDALSDPRVFPGLGDGLGFPSTFLIACEHDAFLPSAEQFATTLRAAGVNAEVRIEAGAAHGHINEPSDETALRTIDAIAAWMRAEAQRG